MSNPKDNWRELAELLGLPVDEPAPTADAPPPAPAFPPATSVLPERHEPELPLDEPMVEVEFAESMPAVSEEPLGGDAGDGPPVAPVEGEERRGRRRGRRGRRRGREDGPEGAEAAPADASERPEPSRRRRPEGDDGDVAPAAAPTRAQAVVDESEQDDFSQDAWADWNVPNWQELIDGLHRPDRDR